MARTVKRFTMLALVSLSLALAAVAIVLGWPPLPTGIWPGITLGIFAALAGGFARREPSRAARRAGWAGLVLGLAAALLGVLVYLGLIFGSARLG